MGQVVVFANTKGGVGKSTLAVHLAVWLSDCGFRVTLLDTDDQQTAATWLGNMPGHDITLATVAQADENARVEDIAEAISRLRPGCDFLVVDTKGSATLATSASIVQADYAFIPIQPSAADIWEITNALTVVRLSQRIRHGAPKATLILNQTAPADAAARDLRRLAAGHAIAVAKTSVPRLNAFRDAPARRSVATRLTDRRGRRAGLRMARLFEELLADYVAAPFEEAANE